MQQAWHSDESVLPAASSPPRFSILTPAYRAEAFIGQAIASLRAQTWTDWESIIVVDGRDDPSYEVARAAIAGDDRFRLYQQEHQGALPAVRRAYAEAKSDMICRIDADDLWEPDYLQSQVKVIGEHPGYDVYAHNGWKLLTDGTCSQLLTGPAFEVEREIEFEEEIEKNVIFTMATFTREIYERAGGFTDPAVGDYGFWLTAMALGARVFYSPARIGVYRLHPGGMSNDLVALEEGVLRVLESVDSRSGLDPVARKAVESAIRRRKARVVRRRLEDRLAHGDSSAARGDYLRARRAYDTKALWWLGLPLMMVSPLLFSRVVARAAAKRTSG